ncbi:glycoside hydrolase family 6 protein [Actinacidiphila glaucinigra]|uniref:Glucanase n=1 Tax=Actinacidiphila glaucinigra TaxID=235986 RepID=A0A239J8K0_9ACTN|nr:glycoside hydrolase family 6 protein [Actinacidiphila glaucinigra]SNT00984.1 endoglucanase [Actinacidiphila glaucinigra]
MFGTNTGPLRRAACAVSAAGLLSVALGGCFGTGKPGGSQGKGGGSSSPQSTSTAGAPFWVNPDTPAARQTAQWRKDGREGDAELLERIAGRPVAEWIGQDDAGQRARRYTEAAARDGRVPVLVLYNIPHRDCGQYSQGGAADGAAYRAWADEVAAGIGDREALVVLEPDALTHIVDGCTPAEFHDERYALLTHAVDTLGALPRVRVYLDAGNAGWVTDPARLAGPLRAAGIAGADGFALNTSNFYTTAANTAYGRKLSARLGGEHFVIDTSRNGRGPLDGAHDEAWCNPPGRGLGSPPTTDTGDELVDAYLWIKRPGDSDGTCKGGPRAGDWWPEYALGLARRAAS